MTTTTYIGVKRITRAVVSQDTRAMGSGGLHRLPSGSSSREAERIERRYASANRNRTRVWRANP